MRDANMGAAPVIYLSHPVLGVQVDGPIANRRLVIKPHLCDLKRVEGIHHGGWNELNEDPKVFNPNGFDADQ